MSCTASRCAEYADVRGSVEVSKPAWTASAISIQPLADKGYYGVRIQRSSVAIAVGLVTHSLSGSYAPITHGFLVERGQVSILENGVTTPTGRVAYDSTWLYIARRDNSVYYCIGDPDDGSGFPGELIWGSSQPSYGGVRLGAAFFAKNDTILEAMLDGVLATTASVRGGFRVGGAAADLPPNRMQGGFHIIGRGGDAGNLSWGSMRGAFHIRGSANVLDRLGARGALRFSGRAKGRAFNGLEPTFRVRGFAKSDAAFMRSTEGGFRIRGKAQSLRQIQYSQLRGQFNFQPHSIWVRHTPATRGHGRFWVGSRAAETATTRSSGSFQVGGWARARRADPDVYLSGSLKLVCGSWRLRSGVAMFTTTESALIYALRDYFQALDVQPARAELSAVIADVASLSARILYLARAEQSDAIALADELTEQVNRLAFMATALHAQSLFSVTQELNAPIGDTFFADDQLGFVARLLIASGLVTHETLFGDQQRAVQMADRLLLAARTAGVSELVAMLGDDLALDEAFLYLARLTLGDAFTLESAFSADGAARVLRLAETIVLAARNSAVLETAAALVEGLVLLTGLDSRYPLGAQDALDLADALAPQLLARLAQLETLQFVDSLGQGIAFFAKSTDAVALLDAQGVTLATLLRQPDMLTFIGRLPLGGEDYQAWVLNADSLGVTEYTNFPLDSLADTPRGTFGLTSTGLYELTGDTDDGVPIEALLRTGDLAFSTSAHKRVDRAYLYLTSTDDVYLKTISTYRGQRKEAWYRVNYRADADDGQTRRVRLGKGLRGTTWAFELSNINGGDFDVRGAEVMPLQLARRV